MQGNFSAAKPSLVWGIWSSSGNHKALVSFLKESTWSPLCWLGTFPHLLFPTSLLSSPRAVGATSSSLQPRGAETFPLPYSIIYIEKHVGAPRNGSGGSCSTHKHCLWKCFTIPAEAFLFNLLIKSKLASPCFLENS